ncbi:NUDIX hydrolase [Pseudomonas asuensis]|uniref:DNA mismatch repair protein MutT n=1 Tax=Pseudomonas asuensis TaxID=1825787 RepID=A0ABQ2H442_9PSED|nr:NUDIX hydrolase [Pseudomonas asuensis]GGM27516.1 DNA mismatch repair protein MutT [Pseudomonas asuensis]
MISVDIDGYRFQVRAAAVLEHDGYILLHRAESDSFWTLPGGRVEPGENAQATLVREMMEELDEPVVCGELLYLVENFFDDLNQPNHEIGLYFRAQPHSHSALLDTSRSHNSIEAGARLEFRWFPRAALHDLDLRPAFLRESLSLPTLNFKHVVQRG